VFKVQMSSASFEATLTMLQYFSFVVNTFFEKFLTIIASATITSLPINFAEVNFFLKLSQKFF
ncbi:hypothetical protein ABER02_14785, partial [Rossellomorea marisflavi]|uniref:hypothetical protein n=1 Tax=Rossellomorea marisflavi TaxID=189381 RepID=UPI003D2E7872